MDSRYSTIANQPNPIRTYQVSLHIHNDSDNKAVDPWVSVAFPSRKSPRRPWVGALRLSKQFRPIATLVIPPKDMANFDHLAQILERDSLGNIDTIHQHDDAWFALGYAFEGDSNFYWIGGTTKHLIPFEDLVAIRVGAEGMNRWLSKDVLTLKISAWDSFKLLDKEGKEL